MSSLRSGRGWWWWWALLVGGGALAVVILAERRAPMPSVEVGPAALAFPSQLLDAAALAEVKNPHAGEAPVCQKCHPHADARISEDGPIAVCAECHDPNEGFNHPLAVAQVRPAAAETGLPHSGGDKIVCHTCHDPHDFTAKKNRERWGLRHEFNALCLKCHAGY